MDNSQLINFKANKDEFTDEVFIITGAGDGIGRAVSLAAAAAGATIVLIGEETKKLESVYDEIESGGHPQAAIYPMNLAGTSAKDFTDMAATIKKELGRLDAVVSNAGWHGGFRPFSQLKVEEYQKTMNINLHAPFWLAHASLPLLQESNNASLLFSDHHSSKAYCGAFGVAKHGISGLVKILAHEYSKSDDAIEKNAVRVNSIDPGPVNTQMRRTLYPGENWNSLPDPGTIASAYLALLSKRNQEVTGQLFDLKEKVDR